MKITQNEQIYYCKISQRWRHIYISVVAVIQAEHFYKPVY